MAEAKALFREEIHDHGGHCHLSSAGIGGQNNYKLSADIEDSNVHVGHLCDKSKDASVLSPEGAGDCVRINTSLCYLFLQCLFRDLGKRAEAKIDEHRDKC